VGLSMAERTAVTKQMARRYQKAPRGQKSKMLDELCALTGWTRRHARRALAQAISGRPQPARRPRPRIYGEDVVEPLRFGWGCSAAGGQASGAVDRRALQAPERHREPRFRLVSGDLPIHKPRS